MTSHTTIVDGRPAHYRVGGTGAPLLFLHGWGLGDRSYNRALRQLVSSGLRVYAPAMPGFGGTAALPTTDRSLAGYARWVAAFAEQVGITQPVTLVGHSFGGGVAIQTAHDAPKLVARLILVNSIGGSTWSNGRGVRKAISERPLWDWGLHLPTDLLGAQSLTHVLPVILRDAMSNLMRSPAPIWRAAHLARTADLTPEMTELNRRKLPVVVVWSQQDNVIPEATLMSLRAELDDPHVVTVPGGHNWLLAEPHRFSEVITNVLALVEPPAHHDTMAQAA
jgi:pimeloyl-ACP methyl ester carboxylesterase